MILPWNESHNFLLLARFGEKLIGPVQRELVAAAPSLWERYTDRQDYPGSAHHSTRAIHLRGPAEWSFEGVQQRLTSIDYVVEQRHLPVTMNFVHSLFVLLNAVDFGRVMVVVLNSFSIIDEHRDEGRYAEYFQRVHLVLSCEPEKDHFYCGDETRVFQEGELWWFNHRQLHSAYNGSRTQPRVHLILDYRQ